MAGSNGAIGGWCGAVLAFVAVAAIGLGWWRSPARVAEAPPSVPLGPGAYDANRVWDLGRPKSGSLRVLVQNASGRPCPNASVWAMEAEVRSLDHLWWTNDEGCAYLEGVPLRRCGDRIRLVGLADGWAGEVVCAASDTTVQLRLTERTLAVRGNLDRPASDPAGKVLVSLYGQVGGHAFPVTCCDVAAGEAEFALVPIPESWVPILNFVSARIENGPNSLICIDDDDAPPDRRSGWSSCTPPPPAHVSGLRRYELGGRLGFSAWSE